MLREVKSVGCDHTGSLAAALHVPSSTARGALDRLETKSLVAGVKHDERDTIENGRVRIYWSLTDAGSAHLDQLKDDQQ